MTLAMFRRRSAFVLAVVGAFLLAPAGVASPASGGSSRTPRLEGTASVFPGMVEVPAGSFKMGVGARWLKRRYRPGANKRRWHPKLLGGSASDYWWWCLMLETPEHTATTEAYAIDRYCVTNAQYLKFLDDTSSVTVFIDENKRSIADVAAEIFGEDNVTDEILTTIYWLNAERLDLQKAKIEKTNSAAVKAALKSFNAGMKVKLKDFDKLPDKERIAAWVGFTLPKGTGLMAYRRHVPIPWPKGKVTKEIADLPVGGVSERDAAAFAAWAGKHIPTEKEWEKAARGPKNWLYPWGPTWDPEKQVDILNWLNTTTRSKGGVAPDTKDRPVPVEDFPRGQSGYGCFQMLGNVAEWTSSVPRLYPGSTAHGAPWFGNPDYRVIRGAYWGGGLPSTPQQPELLIRNSRRIMALSPDRGFPAAWYANGIGFRCAKYHVPTRDVVAQRLAVLGRLNQLPKPDPEKGFVFDASRAYGVELTSYASAGQEGPDHVYVIGPTRDVAFLPISRLAYANEKRLSDAATRRKKGEPPVLLGMIVWNADLGLDAVELVEKSRSGTVHSSGVKAGAKPAGKGKGKGKGDGKGNGKGESGPDKPSSPAPAASSGNSSSRSVAERPGLLLDHPHQAYFVGIEKGRLALFRKAVLGYKQVAWLPPVNAADGKTSILSRIHKVPGKQAHGSATIDPATGIVTISMAVPTLSKLSNDVFALTFRVKIKCPVTGQWTETK